MQPTGRIPFAALAVPTLVGRIGTPVSRSLARHPSHQPTPPFPSLPLFLSITFRAMEVEGGSEGEREGDRASCPKPQTDHVSGHLRKLA